MSTRSDACVILSAAKGKDLKLRILRPFAVYAAQGDGAPIRDSGKYVVTWRKRGGRWVALYDIFNSNMK